MKSLAGFQQQWFRAFSRQVAYIISCVKFNFLNGYHHAMYYHFFWSVKRLLSKITNWPRILDKEQQIKEDGIIMNELNFSSNLKKSKVLSKVKVRARIHSQTFLQVGIEKPKQGSKSESTALDEWADELRQGRCVIISLIKRTLVSAASDCN